MSESIFDEAKDERTSMEREERAAEATDSKLPDDKLTESIIQCVIKVHKALGPAYAESVYRNALVFELKRSGHRVESEKELAIQYEGQTVGSQKVDIVVDELVILTVMTVEKILPVHYARMRSYLRAAGLGVGLMLNFALERSDFRRVEL